MVPPVAVVVSVTARTTSLVAYLRVMSLYRKVSPRSVLRLADWKENHELVREHMLHVDAEFPLGRKYHRRNAPDALRQERLPDRPPYPNERTYPCQC